MLTIFQIPFKQDFHVNNRLFEHRGLNIRQYGALNLMSHNSLFIFLWFFTIILFEGLVVVPPRQPVLQILIRNHVRCENNFCYMCIKTLQWFNDVIQLLALPEVLEAQYKLFSVPPRKSKLQRSMAHTQYESYMTHLEDLVVFCHSALQWQPKRDPRWPALENRGVLRISKWVSHFSLSWCLGL